MTDAIFQVHGLVNFDLCRHHETIRIADTTIIPHSVPLPGG